MLRRILKISWTVHVSNEILVGQSKYSKQLVKTIKKRQLTFLGYVIMKDGSENLAFTGRMNRKRNRRHRTFLKVCQRVQESADPICGK